MKITTNVDDRLLKDAMKATRSRSYREAIECGLRRIIQEEKNHEFVKRFAEYRISWTHDELMRSRA
jgi:Arc/MetJ family transcription regulator